MLGVGLRFGHGVVELVGPLYIPRDLDPVDRERNRRHIDIVRHLAEHVDGCTHVVVARLRLGDRDRQLARVGVDDTHGHVAAPPHVAGGVFGLRVQYQRVAVLVFAVSATFLHVRPREPKRPVGIALEFVGSDREQRLRAVRPEDRNAFDANVVETTDRNPQISRFRPVAAAFWGRDGDCRSHRVRHDHDRRLRHPEQATVIGHLGEDGQRLPDRGRRYPVVVFGVAEIHQHPVDIIGDGTGRAVVRDRAAKVQPATGGPLRIGHGRDQLDARRLVRLRDQLDQIGRDLIATEVDATHAHAIDPPRAFRRMERESERPRAARFECARRVAMDSSRIGRANHFVVHHEFSQHSVLHQVVGDPHFHGLVRIVANRLLVLMGDNRDQRKLVMDRGEDQRWRDDFLFPLEPDCLNYLRPTAFAFRYRVVEPIRELPDRLRGRWRVASEIADRHGRSRGIGQRSVHPKFNPIVVVGLRLDCELHRRAHHEIPAVEDRGEVGLVAVFELGVQLILNLQIIIRREELQLCRGILLRAAGPHGDRNRGRLGLVACHVRGQGRDPHRRAGAPFRPLKLHQERCARVAQDRVPVDEKDDLRDSLRSEIVGYRGVELNHASLGHPVAPRGHGHLRRPVLHLDRDCGGFHREITVAHQHLRRPGTETGRHPIRGNRKHRTVGHRVDRAHAGGGQIHLRWRQSLRGLDHSGHRQNQRFTHRGNLHRGRVSDFERGNPRVVQHHIGHP